MKKYHLYSVLFLFISLMLLVLVGCSNQPIASDETSPEESLPAVTLVEGIDIDFHKMMKADLNQTYSYSGTLDYYRTEVVENVERVINPEAYEVYTLEVNREDLSGGEIGDQSSLKRLKVTDDKIAYIYSEALEEVLLKKPLKVDESWETQVYSENEGFIEVTATIIAVDSDEGITVKYVSNPQSGVDYQRALVFKEEGGIVTERFIMPELMLEHQLMQISSSPDAYYVSRYVHPSDKIMPFYYGDKMSQQLTDGQMKQTLRHAEDEKTRFALYKTYLSQLTFNHMTDVKRMKEITQYAMTLSEDDFNYIDTCIDTYETVYTEGGYDWFKATFLDQNLDIEKFYRYDGDRQVWTFILSSEIENPEEAVIAEVLKACGAGYETMEGDQYFVMTSDFLQVGFYSDDESVMDYLDYKEGQYTGFPLMNDGYIIKTPMQMVEGLHFFESYARQYDNHLGFEEAEHYADYIFDVVAIPNDYESDTSKYINGYIEWDYLDAYLYYVQQYPDSSYTPLLNEIIDALQDSNGFFTKALKEKLESQGYEVNYSRLDQHYKQLEERAFLEENHMFDVTPVSENIVTVDNMTDFLDNIASDVIIEMMPGQYTLNSNMSYGSESVSLSEGVLTIKNVSDFGIRVKDQGKVDLNTDSYLEVIKLDNVNNVSIEDLRIGHIYDYCVGDVISVNNSENIQLDHLILYGCGYNGLSLNHVTTLTLGDSIISDCQASGLVINKGQDINLINSAFYRSGRRVFDISFSKNINLDHLIVKDNPKEMYADERGLFKIISSDPIVTRQSVFDTTEIGRLVEGDGEIIDLP